MDSTTGHGAPPRPPRRDRRATTATSAKVSGIGRRRLVHDDLDGVHPLVGHHVLGDLACHRLDQIAWRPADDVGGPLGQRAVVERVGEVVAGRRRRQIDPHRDVDDEVLAVAPLVVEHAVVCRERSSRATRFGQPSHSDRPRLDAPSARRPRPARRAPAHPTPRAGAASAEITAVAVSRPPGGRGSPSGTGQQGPRKRLRDAPTSTGMPVPTNSGSARSSAQLCSAGLGETQARDR